ncbi:MAG: formylglycine-generating enzyme family protein [Planctomycetaceae bacterium]|jgi:formylglycine-generating enzyme required for sulfatase activity|nr:formylglycine-generating enzyme family protein [Planctomycetaceae bacterium]
MKKSLFIAVFAAVIFAPGQVPSANSLSAAEPKAGERKVVKIKGVDFAFRYCPAGTFTMGSPNSEKNRRDEEAQHEVQLTKGFWLGETEVTQEQWEKITGQNPSHFKGRTLPVESVSWNDCQKYIEQLNNNVPEGYKFALPTEAQWEYACRAGSKTAYYFGDDNKQLGDYTWYHANSDKKTHEAGTKKANAWGLHDMHGNVWEWCSDWYGKYYGNSQLEKNLTPAGKNLYGEDLPKEQLVVKTTVDPTGASSGLRRVFRGGSWLSGTEYCRSAYRDYYSVPGDSISILGLRLCLVPGK